jgi:hypothetical protein
MFKLNFLKKENDLNKLIKKQKRDRGRINILFTSLWDQHSQTLIEKLKKQYGSSEKGEPLYIFSLVYINLRLLTTIVVK